MMRRRRCCLGAPCRAQPAPAHTQRGRSSSAPPALDDGGGQQWRKAARGTRARRRVRGREQSAEEEVH